MRTFKILVSYDGTNFFGWQTQPGRRTVQETLEVAIAHVTGQSVSILSSGRTDTGVHALGQVAGFRLETRLTSEVFRRALNAVLPRDIAVHEVSVVHEGFHPTHDVRRKRYLYLIHDGPVRDVFRRQYCWHFIQGRLDAEAMHRAALPLMGTHDFSSFETAGSERNSNIRTIFEISVQRGGAAEQDWVDIEVEADGFLYNMVRAIVGTLVEVGRGVKPETWPAEVLEAADRQLAGPTVPPQGLFLVKVDYYNRG